jgi:hypothetical protein
VENLSGYRGLLQPLETPKCEVYGGVRKDVEFSGDLFAHRTANDRRPDAPLPPIDSVDAFAAYVDGFLKCVIFLTLDLPFTFVADTVTLPYTVEKTLEKRNQPVVEKTNSP